MQNETLASLQVTYSLRRLTALQTQNLYVGPQSESHRSDTPAPDLKSLYPGADAKPDPIKGGLRVTSFFTYNCLAVSLDRYINYFYTDKKRGEKLLQVISIYRSTLATNSDFQDSRDLYSECLRTFWSCPNCDLYMPLTPLERLQHEGSCRPPGEQKLEEGEEFFCA